MMSSKPKKPQSYELNGEKFQLPPANLGKPLKLQEITGVLEPWPAHASGRAVPSSQIALARSGDLIVLNEQESKLPNLVPKPKFLENLERYIHKQLHEHKVADVCASPIRLQIYREVFEWLIEAFKTYKPLLAEVKREYEMMLTYYRDEIRKMEPMKDMLWTLSQECDQKIMKMRDSEKKEIETLKAEKKKLEEEIIVSKKKELQYKVQVDRLKEDLAKEHEKYRDEADSKKLLIGNLNELRSQQEELMSLKQQEHVSQEDDPVQLKLAYNQAKKAHSEALAKLIKMEADYCDVVPRKEFEALNTKHDQLFEKFKDTNSLLDAVKNKAEALQEQFNTIHSERDTYYTKWQELQRSSTPRPNWDKCANVVFGGEDRWKELSKDKSSNELVEILMGELSGASTGDDSMLEPMGTDESVPKFLRHNEPVQNRRMTKRDCRLHIREVWDQRKSLRDEAIGSQAKGEKHNLPPMDEFLDEFFRKVYGLPQIRIEWAYSFYAALKQFQVDDTVALFLGIINGETDEEIFWDEMSRINKLLELFQESDRNKKEEVTFEVFNTVLKTQFPNLDEERIESLVSSVKMELNIDDSQIIEYPKLFMTDDEGGFGPFLQEIRKLLNEEKKKYIEDIHQELKDLGTSTITAADLRRTFSIVDPKMDPGKLEACVGWAFGTVSDNLEMAPAIELEELIQKLHKGNINRVGPRV